MRASRLPTAPSPQEQESAVQPASSPPPPQMRPLLTSGGPDLTWGADSVGSQVSPDLPRAAVLYHVQPPPPPPPSAPRDAGGKGSETLFLCIWLSRSPEAANSLGSTLLLPPSRSTLWAQHPRWPLRRQEPQVLWLPRGRFKEWLSSGNAL